jgi:hypothetical protein
MAKTGTGSVSAASSTRLVRDDGFANKTHRTQATETTTLKADKRNKTTKQQSPVYRVNQENSDSANKKTGAFLLGGA